MKVPEGQPKIAQRFSAGFQYRVSFGTTEFFVAHPLCRPFRDLEKGMHVDPALKRWAIFKSMR